VRAVADVGEVGSRRGGGHAADCPAGMTRRQRKSRSRVGPAPTAWQGTDWTGRQLGSGANGGAPHKPPLDAVSKRRRRKTVTQPAAPRPAVERRRRSRCTLRLRLILKEAAQTRARYTTRRPDRLGRTPIAT